MTWATGYSAPGQPLIINIDNSGVTRIASSLTPNRSYEFAVTDSLNRPMGARLIFQELVDRPGEVLVAGFSSGTSGLEALSIGNPVSPSGSGLFGANQYSTLRPNHRVDTSHLVFVPVGLYLVAKLAFAAYTGWQIGSGTAKIIKASDAQKQFKFALGPEVSDCFTYPEVAEVLRVRRQLFQGQVEVALGIIGGAASLLPISTVYLGQLGGQLATFTLTESITQTTNATLGFLLPLFNEALLAEHPQIADGRKVRLWLDSRDVPAGSGTTQLMGIALRPDDATCTALEKVSGDNQLFPPPPGQGRQLIAAVKDDDGGILPGVTVDFTPLGGGTVNPASVATNNYGQVSTTWVPASASSSVRASIRGQSAGSQTYTLQIAQATKLTFTTQPPNATAGATLSPSPQVAIQTAAGATVTTATNSVILTLTSNSTGAVLSGTTTRAAVNGVATFNDLKVDKAGTYTLTAATTGLSGATSQSFTITVSPATPAKLTFTTQPSNATAGATLSPSPQVAIQTAALATVTTANNSVILTLTSNSTGAVLSGTVTRNAVNGVVTFNDLKVDKAGTYTLTAASTGLTGVVSQSFTMGGVTPPSAPAITGITAGDGQLSVTFSPPTSNGGAAITNYQYSTNGGSSWTLRSPASTASPLVITGVVNGTPYAVALRAVNSAGGGASSDVMDGTPTGGPAVQLVIMQQPSSTGPNFAKSILEPLVVSLRTASGAVAVDATSLVTVALATSPSGAVLGGVLEVTAQGGEARFDKLVVDRPGTYALSVSSQGMSGAATTNFQVMPESGAGVLGLGFGIEQFALIPGGTFMMGSNGGDSDERPPHSVTITQPLRLQKTEVTQAQWNQVMENNPSFFSACGVTCPVEAVSWDDIQLFLVALNQQDPGKGYRLPTEAEWEYAARAGTTGDFNVFGQPVTALGWINTNSQNSTWPVAQKLPNAWGLYDIHGNVWEWVQDRYGSTYYSVSPTNDPPGPATGLERVLRGGSWPGSASNARTANRDRVLPLNRSGNGGFRLVRVP